MLLRSSISKTRKFFQKTLENFKSVFSSGYQKLPKSPICSPYPSCIYSNNNFQTSFKDSEDKFYDFANEWDDSEHHKGTSKKTNEKNEKIDVLSASKTTPSSSKTSQKQEKEVLGGSVGSFKQFHANAALMQKQRREGTHFVKQKVQSLHGHDSCFKRTKAHEGGRRRLPVAEKLRELEMVMEIRSADHVMDIQEFLHYYSRLDCPAYLDIVEEFFMDMCNEFLGPIEPPRRAVSSTPRIGFNRGNKTTDKFNYSLMMN